MVLLSTKPGHSRSGVVNVGKFSGTNLSSLLPGNFGTYPSAVEGPLPAISFPPRFLPFHGAALSTLLRALASTDGFCQVSVVHGVKTRIYEDIQ